MINIIEVIKRSISLYFKNFFSIFLVIVWLLIIEIVFLFLPGVKTSPLVDIFIKSAILAFLFLLGTWTDQLLTIILFGCYKNQKVKIREGMMISLRQLPAYVFVTILWIIIIGIGFLLLVVPGLIFMTWYLFMSPVFVVEGKRGWQVFRRSHELSHNLGLKIFSRFFVPSLFFFLIFLVLYQLATVFLSPLLKTNLLYLVLSIISVILIRLSLPLFSGVIVILYDEVKKLKEQNET
jgi:hypothetical protein